MVYLRAVLIRMRFTPSDNHHLVSVIGTDDGYTFWTLLVSSSPGYGRRLACRGCILLAFRAVWDLQIQKRGIARLPRIRPELQPLLRASCFVGSGGGRGRCKVHARFLLAFLGVSAADDV